MKKWFALLLTAALVAGCQRASIGDIDDEIEQESITKTKKFTFTVKGDFGEPTFTAKRRAYMTADGQDMTDLWVFDFMGGECVQTLHQVPTDEDWGAPVMALKYGSHHVYFVASRGDSPTVDETGNTITWGTPRDTFWKDYEVSVVSTSNGNRAVTLDRVVTKLKVKFEDEVPTGCSEIAVTPAEWYYGLNYVTGAPCDMKANQPRTVSVPESYVGTSGVVSVSIFGFSTASEWATDVQVTSKNATGETLGTATIKDAPFKANRATEYSGCIFGSNGAVDVSLTDDWDDPITGEW